MMRTKLVTAALATLLTVGSTAVAFAQAADTIYAERQQDADVNQTSSPSATQNYSFASAPQSRTHGSSVASAGPSARHQPQG